MELKYFAQAVKDWCAKNKWNRELPVTASWLSDMLQHALTLQETDRKKTEGEA
jgi:hypothetical protein